MAKRNISRRAQLSLVLLIFLVIEAALGFYLFQIPPDGLGMRPLLSKVVNSPDSNVFTNRQSPVEVEGIDEAWLASLRPLVEEVIKDAPDDFSRALATCRWVGDKLVFAKEPPGPVSITELINGLVQGQFPSPLWCDGFARIYFLACGSVGIETRIIHLSEKSGSPPDAHYTGEVWIPGLSKWVLMDAFYNLYIEIDGQPASALEIHRAACGLTSPEKIIIKKSRGFRELPGSPSGLEFSPEKYLRYFERFQIVGGSVFSSGKELLLKNKRIIFYNFVDEASPKLRPVSGAEPAIILFKYILPLLILLFLVLLISTYRRTRRPRERLPFIPPPRR